MVADTARRPSSAEGLRPLSLARDWRQVLELIRVAFGENLDAEARRALHGMQLPPLLAPLIGLIDGLSPPGEGMMPGFVWVHQGQVVGTASVRRLHPHRRGWLISNVAVHPDVQGQGIGRALLEASLDFAAAHGGGWVVLQTRDDNRVACKLYESLGFRGTAQVVRLRRAPGAKLEPVPTPPTSLRRARWSEGSALYRLARQLTPQDMLWTDAVNRSLYRTGPWDRLVGWLQGCRRQWWVEDRGKGPLQAAVAVEVDARNPWHRLRLLLAPEAQDEARVRRLVDFGLVELLDERPQPIEIEHPASDSAVQAALDQAGFRPIYALIHMRLDLR